MKDELAQVGPRLRTLRQSQGLTLEQLAEAAQMSASTLSRLESGKRQASLELLLPLTRRLGIGLDDLLPQQTADPRVRRPAINHNGIVMVPLAPEHSPILTYKITYPAQNQQPEPKVHDGYEWLYVISGKLRLQLGEREFLLNRGEAAEFDTRTPHAMSAAGGRSAQVISIFNQSGAKLHTRASELPDQLSGPPSS